MDETQQTEDQSSALPTIGSLALAGDWHGNLDWAVRCLRQLASLGVREVFHLGDFGLWPGERGRHYVDRLEGVLRDEEMVLFVTPGNHEDYDQIASLPAMDRGHDAGAVQWVTDHLALLPRGHRLERFGWSIVSLGGAPSIDFESRVPGQDWWPGELITNEEVEAVAAEGPADIMLAHDAPDADYATAAVGRIIASNPLGYGKLPLSYCAVGRRRMTSAFLGVRPKVFAHGHFHAADQRTFAVPGWGYETIAVSVDCDGATLGNLALLHLPERGDGAVPRVEWVEVDLAGRVLTFDGVTSDG